MWVHNKNNITLNKVVFLINVFQIKIICGRQLYLGDVCVIKTTGEPGQCVEIEKCEYAIKLLKEKQMSPQDCGFEGLNPVVCCPFSTEDAGKSSETYCRKKFPETKFHNLIVGGKKSLAKEFPHMAILGYGKKGDIQWLCGGTLISDNFVLTAAHCATTQEFGKVKWVRLGDLDIANSTDDAEPQNFTVVKTYKHPSFKPPSHYHDIALLKLNQSIRITQYVKPACLYPNRSISATTFVATGWGKVDYAGQASSQLLKVDLNYVDLQECEKAYKSDIGSRLSKGIMDDLQICAGGEEGKDTCQGDSGGPLQLKLARGRTIYPSIVGVTSFGKACGIGRSIGVYTRVSEYLSWIEAIVWGEGIPT